MSEKNKSFIPIHDINDGYTFQQIVAEYFRSLKSEKQDFHIADIDVDDSGIGSDNGCDILVSFHFEDAIGKHTHKWVVECKSQKQAVNNRDININSLLAILKNKNANGYLLVCKYDASTSLKELLNGLRKDCNIEVWNGAQLWGKFIGSKKLIHSFFADYYEEYFVKNRAIEKYDSEFDKYEKQLKQ